MSAQRSLPRVREAACAVAGAVRADVWAALGDCGRWARACGPDRGARCGRSPWRLSDGWVSPEAS